MLLKNWQVNGIGSWVSGTPFTVGGDNGLLGQQAPACRRPTSPANSKATSARPARTSRGTTRRQFSQPGNAWGNSGRNAFRGPSNWNLDFSLFKAIPVGRYRMEFRAESTNVFNHSQWGNPVTRGITDPNFMRIRGDARPRNPRHASSSALGALERPDSL